MKKASLFLLSAIIAYSFGSTNVNKKSNQVELKAKVEKWLDSQKTKDNKYLETIDGVKRNLEIDSAWYNDYEKGETILTIPIRSSFVFTNNKDKKVKNYLVLFLNAKNKFRSNYVWQIIEGSTFTKNTIANNYNSVEEDLNGTYCLLSLYDMFLLENYFEKNKRIRVVQPIAKPSKDPAKSNCSDWYLAKFETFENEFKESETYITTTCNNRIPKNLNEKIETVEYFAN